MAESRSEWHTPQKLEEARKDALLQFSEGALASQYLDLGLLDSRAMRE